MLDFKKLFKKSNEEKEEGQGLVEYALILLLVALVVIVVLTTLGGSVSTTFGKITSALS